MRCGSIRMGLGRACWAGALGVALLAASCSSDKKADDTTSTAADATTATTAAPTTTPPVTTAAPATTVEVTAAPTTEEATTTTEEPATTGTEAPTTTEATTPQFQEFVDCPALTAMPTWETAADADDCDFTSGPLACGAPAAGFRSRAQDMCLRRASVFDLGVYAGGAYTTDWFHEPFEDGPSFGQIYLLPTFEDGTGFISVDCAGRMTDGEAPLSPFQFTPVPFPLYQFGPCNIRTVEVRLENGRVINVPVNMFPDNGLFNVVAEEHVTDPADLDAEALRLKAEYDFLRSLSEGIDPVISGPSITGSFEVILEAWTNTDIGCIALTSPFTGTGPVGCSGDEPSWNLQSTAFFEDGTSVDGADFGLVTPVLGSVGALVQLPPTGGSEPPVISDPIEPLFPPGPGPIAYTVGGPGPMQASGFLVGGVIFNSAFPIGPGGDFSELRLVVGPSTWTLAMTDAGLELTSSDGATTARAAIRDNAVALFLPMSEVPDVDLGIGDIFFEMDPAPPVALTNIGHSATGFPTILLTPPGP